MSILLSPVQKEKIMNIKINNEFQAFEVLSLSEGLVLNVSDGQFLIQQKDDHLEIINLEVHQVVFSSNPDWNVGDSSVEESEFWSGKPKKTSKSFEEYVLNGIGPVYKKSEDCFD